MSISVAQVYYSHDVTYAILQSNYYAQHKVVKFVKVLVTYHCNAFSCSGKFVCISVLSVFSMSCSVTSVVPLNSLER